MRIEKTRLLVCESVYGVNMIADNENTVKQYSSCLEYQNTQPKENTTLYKVLTKPGEVVCRGVFMINFNNLLCTVDYNI